MIRNLIEFSADPLIENHVIYTINTEDIKHFKIDGLKGVFSEQVFNFSPRDNFYHTCTRLSKLIRLKSDVLVVHDWLELGMISHLGLQNPVVQFLHGDYPYYYDLAKKHEASIDKFIGVAQEIRSNLFQIIPHRKNDIEYLRFPVATAFKRKKRTGGCNIVFVGRLTDDKGFPLLPTIASALDKEGIKAEWHIIGEDPEGIAGRSPFNKNITVNYYGSIGNDKVRQLLPLMDFFILPSKAEGMPVSLVEAMKAGLIPLVNDLPGGIRELVTDGETGFRIAPVNTLGYSERLISLINNPEDTEQMREQCIKKASGLFDPVSNTKLVEEFIVSAKDRKTQKHPFKVYGSRLDRKWFPNFLVKTIRKIR